MARILVVDNYDSFVYNLVQYLQQLGAECVVRRNDAVTAGRGRRPGQVDGVLLSPGPGAPADAGVTEEMIRWCAGRMPCSGCASVTRRSPRSTAAWWTGPRNSCTAAPPRSHHDGADGLCRIAAAVHRDPLPLAGRAERNGAGRVGSHRPDRGRSDHGPAAPRAPGGGRAVPSGVGAHPGRPSTAGELAVDMWRSRRPRCWCRHWRTTSSGSESGRLTPGRCPGPRRVGEPPRDQGARCLPTATPRSVPPQWPSKMVRACRRSPCECWPPACTPAPVVEDRARRALHPGNGDSGCRARLISAEPEGERHYAGSGRLGRNSRGVEFRPSRSGRIGASCAGTGRRSGSGVRFSGDGAGGHWADPVPGPDLARGPPPWISSRWPTRE